MCGILYSTWSKRKILNLRINFEVKVVKMTQTPGQVGHWGWWKVSLSLPWQGWHREGFELPPTQTRLDSVMEGWDEVPIPCRNSHSISIGRGATQQTGLGLYQWQRRAALGELRGFQAGCSEGVPAMGLMQGTGGGLARTPQGSAFPLCSPAVPPSALNPPAPVHSSPLAGDLQIFAFYSGAAQQVLGAG